MNRDIILLLWTLEQFIQVVLVCPLDYVFEALAVIPVESLDFMLGLLRLLAYVSMGLLMAFFGFVEPTLRVLVFAGSGLNLVDFLLSILLQGFAPFQHYFQLVPQKLMFPTLAEYFIVD